MRSAPVVRPANYARTQVATEGAGHVGPPPFRPPSASLRATPAGALISALARSVRAISKNQTKSGREDAQMLARLGRADPKLLSPVRHRTEETQRAFVRRRVNLINSVRFLSKSLGVFVSSSIKAIAVARKVRAQLARTDLAAVGPLVAAINTLNAQVKALDAELETLGGECYPGPHGSARSLASGRLQRCASS